jgi:hypothetical protein
MGDPVALKRILRGLALVTAGLPWVAAGVPARADTGAPAVVEGPSEPTVGAAHCRFVVPEGLAPGEIRWAGGCRSGMAEGRGILRAYEHGRVVRVFYGTLRAGQPALGVVDLGDGYMAGRFEAGRLVRDGDRNTLLAAFNDAQLAARRMAERLRAAGNAASTRFYQDKAMQLERQMD